MINSDFVKNTRLLEHISYSLDCLGSHDLDVSKDLENININLKHINECLTLLCNIQFDILKCQNPHLDISLHDFIRSL